MNQHMFIRNRFSYNFQKFVDPKYQLSVFLLSVIILMFQFYESFFETFKTYDEFFIYAKAHFVQISILFLIQLGVLIFFSIVFRIMMGVFFEPVFYGIQRVISFTVTVLYLFFVYYFGYQTRSVLMYDFINIHQVTFIFWFCVTLSVWFLTVARKHSYQSNTTRLTLFISFVISLLFCNWISFYFGKNDKNLNNLNLSLVVVNGNQGQQVSTQELTSRFEQSQLVLNLGTLGNGPEVLQKFPNKLYCPKYDAALFEYQTLKALFPVALLLPEPIVAWVMPKSYCLNMGSDISRVLIWGVHLSTHKLSGNSKNIIAFLDGNLYRTQVDYLIQNASFFREKYKQNTVQVDVFFLKDSESHL